EITGERPLQTRLSDGAYEPGSRRGSLKVRGELSTVWEVQHPPRRGKKAKPAENVLLVGKASTMLRILEQNDDGTSREIAMWRTEVGDAASPGCHFHVQVLGHEEHPPFPKALSVPRLPAMAITAMDAFEFLLGELFQNEWRAESAKESFQQSQWRSIQRARL